MAKYRVQNCSTRVKVTITAQNSNSGIFYGVQAITLCDMDEFWYKLAQLFF